MDYLEFRIEYVVFNDNGLLEDDSLKKAYFREKICLNRNSQFNIEKIIFITLTDRCNELGYNKAILLSFTLLGHMEVTKDIC